MANNRFRFVAVATTIVQLGFGVLALWMLWDTKVSSDRFSLEYVGEPLRYKPAAVLVPLGLVVLFGIAAVSALLWSQFRHARTVFVLSLAVALAIVAVWWVALALSNYRDLFVAAGALRPNEIMGASWSLSIIVALLSLATLLGLVPLVCLWLDHTRSTKRCM